MVWKRKHRRRLADARMSGDWVKSVSQQHGVSLREILAGHDTWLESLDDEMFERHLFGSCEVCMTTIQAIAEIEGENRGRG